MTRDFAFLFIPLALLCAAALPRTVQAVPGQEEGGSSPEKALPPVAEPAGRGSAQEPEDALVPLIAAGRSEWQIVHRTDEPETVAFAARELQRYLHQMTRCELPIAAAAPGGPAMRIGLRANLAPEDLALLPPPAQGHDGYAIAIRGETAGLPPRIVVAGDNPRGVLYGAYDLLERLGCRWFYPAQDPSDPEVVPRSDVLEAVTGTWAKASPVRYRIANGSAWFFDMDLVAARKQLDWAAKNRYNAMGWQSESKTSLAFQYRRMQEAGLLKELERRGMFLHGPGHSFDQFLKAEEHMAAHPEWFGLRDGKRVPQSFLGAQFCWSNGQARRQFVANVEAFVAASPQIRILCIVPFDGGRRCDCPECRKAGASNLLMVLLSEVIERLEVSAPGVLVETVGGYEPVTEPPTAVQVHPKQRIIWAHWGRYHGIGYGDDRYDRRANLEAWRKAAPAGITICQYYTDNFCQPWILQPFATAIQEDRRYFLEKGIDSVYVLMWPPGYWWNHGLNGYIAGRCFFDASLDPFLEIRDYALRYFGPTAGQLLAKYYEEWARKVDLAYHVRDGANDEDRATLAKERRDLVDPAMAAVKADSVLSRRVGKVEKLHALAERLAEAYRRTREVGRLRQESRLTAAAKLLEDATTYTDELLAFFRSLADLDQGLMDRNEVPGFISLRLKGWIEEERKALGAGIRE